MYGVQKAIMDHADFWTQTNLRRVSQSFRKLKSPPRISMLEICVENDVFSIWIFDKNLDKWIIFDYHKLSDDSCVRTIGYGWQREESRSKIIEGKCYEKAFVSSLIYLIDRMELMEHFRFICSKQDDNYGFDYPKRWLKVFGERLKGRISAKKLTLAIVPDCDDEEGSDPKYYKTLIEMLNPRCLESIKLCKIDITEIQGRRRAYFKIEDRLKCNKWITRSEQWKAARHLECEDVVVGERQLMGFETIRTSERIDGQKLKKEFLKIPPANKCSIYMRPEKRFGRELGLQDGLGTVRFPIPRHENKDLVMECTIDHLVEDEDEHRFTEMYKIVVRVEDRH